MMIKLKKITKLCFTWTGESRDRKARSHENDNDKSTVHSHGQGGVY